MAVTRDSATTIAALRARIGPIVAVLATVVMTAITVITWSRESTPTAHRPVRQRTLSAAYQVRDCDRHLIEIERLHWPCDAEIEAGCDPEIPIAYKREDVSSYPYCLRSSGMLRGRAPSDEVTVTCGREGSVAVNTTAVVAHPEGVRVNLVLDGYRRTFIKGLRVEGKEPRTELISAAAPGWHLVGCSHPSVPAGFVEPLARLLVVDIADHWVAPPPLDCSNRGAASGSFGVVDLETGDPARELRDMHDFIRPSDAVVISGYTDGRRRGFHVLRDRRSFYELDLFRNDGRWGIANSTSCISDT